MGTPVDIEQANGQFVNGAPIAQRLESVGNDESVSNPLQSQYTSKKSISK